MTVQNLEKQLLELDAGSRAKLANKLLSSLEDLSEAEVERLWAEEAVKRDEELKTGKVKARSASSVFRNARKRFK